MNPEDLTHVLGEEPFTINGLLFQYYTRLGLTDEQFLILLHIRRFHQEGHDFPTPEDIESRMTSTKEACTKQLQELSAKRFIEIIDLAASDGKMNERVSIQPLYEKLAMLYFEQSAKQEEKQQKEREGELYKRFEEEFGRPLSPMEMEMISMWLDDDQHDPVLIEAALREAVVSSRMNFRYIDRILFDWKKNGVKTVEQAKIHGEKVRGYKEKQPKKTNASEKTDEQKPAYPGYNWLEGGD
ncbi:DnaD domain-containing protein [Salisediminibacterium halotolerans]|uniref:DNA replication protein n=1 Tax=Salisediminibacterium halotolerans TaxID=517425 RepID=A0A1H9NZ24_9BACI|nr:MULTISPECIES: DnaD domain-containing protein [Salisediminibacterium]RLJ77905.1 DNA replication protein DnaD [Actinophytocola xinjiangensis]RPE88757.1 DNA replication protein DnaD [Salisediminibacterium halotolerans]TWG36882.1 DNA replication protein DnaD [Salisediminibacterium halotolerans]SER41192.1 DNA replication protein [Salisediminibacterium haloalkalitolerans]GEL07432.1 DNA replication protein DnaD [Salisediminibacterium halotolerans]